MGTDARASITETDHGGFTAVVYRNPFIEVTLLPEVGAKVIGLKDLRSNHEWLTTPARPVRRLSNPADLWQEYDMSGWDECFPSVAGGHYPRAPWAGVPVRDMGELWHRPWQWKDEGSGISTIIHGLRFPYEFHRHLGLADDTLEITYGIRNLTEVPFLGLWSMHPLFAAHPGTRILFPSATTMVVESSLEDSAQASYRERLTWPALSINGSPEDLSVMRHPANGHALKLFSAWRSITRAALYEPGPDAWLGIEVTAETVPHFGLWVNEGRWPGREEGLFHVALEPTNGFADSLDVAAALGSGIDIPGHSACEWNVSMVFGAGAGDAATFVERGRKPAGT
jgi:hypothetical protein